MRTFYSFANAASILAVVSLIIGCSRAPAPSARPPVLRDNSAVEQLRRMGFRLETQPISFSVRFTSRHPLGWAQALEAEGKRAQALRLARETIAASSELEGLCFDRFTLGGAEIVLVSCKPVSKAEVGAVQQAWIRRLQAMSSVEYADINVVVPV